MAYLRIKNEEFSRDRAPSRIIPGVEYVKNSERSLDGSLHVDIAAVKQRLQVIFDVLNQSNYNHIMDIFEVVADTSKIDPEGLDITYFNIDTNAKRNGRFSVENVAFNPLVTDGGVLWRDVTFDLIEL